jgi:hypothetical protein
MTARDKEFVTKIQLNQMVALSGSGVQNYRGKFTFSRSMGAEIPSSPSAVVTEDDQSSALGKRLYSSVYHPRKLVDLSGVVARTQLSRSATNAADQAARNAVEKCFDLLIDLTDIDQYISTLHPLAEDKINEAIAERTEHLEEVTGIIVSDINRVDIRTLAKAGIAKKRAIDFIVEILQPQSVATEAEARRTLIFRRVPESVQALYIDMLERIVGDIDQ